MKNLTKVKEFFKLLIVYTTHLNIDYIIKIKLVKIHNELKKS